MINQRTFDALSYEVKPRVRGPWTGRLYFEAGAAFETTLLSKKRRLQD